MQQVLVDTSMDSNSEEFGEYHSLVTCLMILI